MAHELPRSARLGDGTMLRDGDVEEIRYAYERERVVFPWQQGDVLLLDNMLTAHGRMPFSGLRSVLVAMTEPYAAHG